MTETFLALGGGGLLDDLGINWKVIVVQMIIFLATVWILSTVLFRPITSFQEKRNKEIEEAAKGIEDHRAEVEKLTADYREKIAKIESEANDKLQEAIREGQEQRRKIIADAENEAKAELDKAREVIRKEQADAQTALRAEVKRLALEAAERLTGQKYDAAKHGGIVDEVLKREVNS